MSVAANGSLQSAWRKRCTQVRLQLLPVRLLPVLLLPVLLPPVLLLRQLGQQALGTEATQRCPLNSTAMAWPHAASAGGFPCLTLPALPDLLRPADAPLSHALLARSGACCDETVAFLVDRCWLAGSRLLLVCQCC
jgi:hypothetical protein